MVWAAIFPLPSVEEDVAALTPEERYRALDGAAKQPAAAAVAAAMARHLRRVATTQVRGVASWAGNVALAAAAPALPSDVLTLLAAAGATLTLASRSPGSEGQLTAGVPVATYVRGGGSAGLIVDATVPLRGSLAFADKTSQRHANSIHTLLSLL